MTSFTLEDKRMSQNFLKPALFFILGSIYHTQGAYIVLA